MPSFEDYLAWRCQLDDPLVELDFAHSGLTTAALDGLTPALGEALAAMAAIEMGGIANRDENRQVGHYWLRAPGLAPDDEISQSIADAIAAVEEFARVVHTGAVSPPDRDRFERLLVIGIGGSALGPMLLADCFRSADQPMTVTVLDNTDPAGIDSVLGVHGSLADTLVIVISKSGGTAETRNGMLEVRAACEAQGLGFAERAVAITGAGSELSKRAATEQWLTQFPMWDWVGGRTSVTSAVGLVPGALAGLDIRAFLAGAAAMDECTRNTDVRRNPAALLAAWWHHEGGGAGKRDMIVLPYQDSLQLFGRYLQQLVMESLGKELDRQGNAVFQGLAVYGNKGSTDQHAYVQQLRDGLHNFFVTFIRVLEDRRGASLEVEPGVTSGDYLHGFWLGTRAALTERGRHSATITVQRTGERTLGALVALFERAVGIYAELVDVNAYHQPGVEAGKRAAKAALEVQSRLLAALDGTPRTAKEIAAAVGEDAEPVWQILRHVLANREEVRVDGPLDPEVVKFSCP